MLINADLHLYNEGQHSRLEEAVRGQIAAKTAQMNQIPSVKASNC
jgi:hypothetical protein